MSPILGIFASSYLSAVGDYESIATVTVGGGGASSVEFSSIASTYSHLQIRMAFTKSAAGYFYAYFNNDTSPSNYHSHYLEGNGTTAGAGANSDAALGYLGNSSTKPIGSILDVLDYSSVNKYTTSRALTGQHQGGGASIVFASTLWESTSAVNTIKIIPASGTIGQHSHFALYGVK
jgi:hypothetical protein